VNYQDGKKGGPVKARHHNQTSILSSEQFNEHESQVSQSTMGYHNRSTYDNNRDAPILDMAFKNTAKEKSGGKW